MTVRTILDTYRQDADIMGFNVTPEREETARGILEGYGADLEGYGADLACRFTDGGDCDTYEIPSGETFVEIVCGGYFNGKMPVRCYEPLIAMQLFIDAVERYIVTKPKGHTLHWHTRPEWSKHHEEVIDRWHLDSAGCESHYITRTVYSIYARLVLV